MQAFCWIHSISFFVMLQKNLVATEITLFKSSEAIASYSDAEAICNSEDATLPKASTEADAIIIINKYEELLGDAIYNQGCWVHPDVLNEDHALNDKVESGGGECAFIRGIGHSTNDYFFLNIPCTFRLNSLCEIITEPTTTMAPTTTPIPTTTTTMAPTTTIVPIPTATLSYNISDTPANFTTAIDGCQYLQSELAVLNTTEEFERVKSLNANSNEGLWVDLQKINETTLEWGGNNGFVHVGSAELPSMDSGDCASLISSGGSSRYQTAECHTDHKYLCQKVVMSTTSVTPESKDQTTVKVPLASLAPTTDIFFKNQMLFRPRSVVTQKDVDKLKIVAGVLLTFAVGQILGIMIWLKTSYNVNLFRLSPPQ